MANTCLNIATLVCGVFAFILLSIATGTRRWKEDIDFYKNTHSFIGLWQACFLSAGREVVGYPYVAMNCDKDYLRPHLKEPPSWFNSVRALMLLSCFGTGFGILFYLIAFITDNSKKTGSKFWPSAAVMFLGGLCAVIALSIFTVHKQYGIQYELGGNEFHAQYWKVVEEKAIIEGGEYKIETWLRWSYMVGWAGCFMTLCALICAVLSDLINMFKR